MRDINLTIEDLIEIRRALNNRSVVLTDRYNATDNIDMKESIDEDFNQLEKTRSKINSLIKHVKHREHRD